MSEKPTRFTIEVLCPFCKKNKVKLISTTEPSYTDNSGLWYKSARTPDGTPGLLAYFKDKPLLILCNKESPATMLNISPNQFSPSIPNDLTLSR